MAGEPGREPSPSAQGRNWFEPALPADPAAVNEPTRLLPVVPAAPPTVSARAVIVYEERPRRPWKLWVFTVALVALTAGVVLGQTVAFEPVYRRPQVVAAPADLPPATGPVGAVPSGAAPGPVPGAWPDATHRVTAPLAGVRARVLEVTGESTVLRVRGADLGDTLFDIATTDRGALPSITESDQGSRLDLVRTGEPGTVGADIQLNDKVVWTLRLAGGAAEQTVDLREGRLAGLQVTGGAGLVVVQLPAPKGTVPLSVTGPVREVVLRAPAAAPVRLRLDDGARTAVVDGRTRRKVEAGTELIPRKWQAARNRYDVVTSGPVTTIRTDPY